MYYDKQIHYIDYLENGEKRYNSGYAKITVAGSRMRLEMQIRGLYETDDVTAQVLLEGGGIECGIGAVLIRQGCGNQQWEFLDPVHEGEGIVIREGLCYGQLEQIEVQISPRRVLRCVWREKTAQETGSFPEAVSEVPGTGRTSAASSSSGDRQKEIAALGGSELSVDAPPEAGESAVLSQVPEYMEDMSAATKLSADAPSEAGESAVVPQVPEYMEDMPAATKLEADAPPEAGESAALSQVPEYMEDMSAATKLSADASSKAGESAVVPQVREYTEDMSAAKKLSAATKQVADAPAGTDRDVTVTENEAPEGTGQRAGMQTKEAQRRSLHGPRTTAVCEDKWQQLWKIYPHIRPFWDEREYLSLWPEDFVILHSNAYRLAHNSFLLHGYYNYEHLILTQMSVKGGKQYYIGVPGNFYEKEKQVAIMFGFESFECRQEPAQEGDFGYYMIRVEL